MQEELIQFKWNDGPYSRSGDKNVIGIKYVFSKEMDENVVITKNKSMLVEKYIN